MTRYDGETPEIPLEEEEDYRDFGLYEPDEEEYC